MSAIDWQVIVTIGAALGIGEALVASGAADHFGDAVIAASGSHPVAALVIVMAITMTLTNIVNAKATAALVFPVVVRLADTLNADLVPFAIGLMIAAAGSYATPIGYQTNLMVYGPGGYRFTDYLRVGVPLSVLVLLTSVLVIPRVWPF